MLPSAQVKGTLAEVRGIEKAFDGRKVLDAVSLTVTPGEIVSLVGPNGSGKTTLVRVILGLTKPDAGTVTLRPGLRIGYVPQRLAVDAVLPLSVGRFLALGRRASAERQGVVLEEVGARHLLDLPFAELSSGEQQRVLLARALLRAPDLLVLDEPVQGVDMTGRSALYQMIARIKRERGLGVLMVSHDLHLVMAATDEVVCLNHHVCCSGRPEVVSRHPEYIALFGEDVSRALAVYTHAHDHSHDAAGNVLPVDDEGA
jgi:zinc transport system ATP-binding protein